jgi:tetratricopeptide (TPR) repeat protein
MSKINWKELLDWGEDQVSDLRNVGYAYVKQGEYDIALKFFKALNAIDPQNSYDLRTLGAIYLQQGKSLEALNYIDQSLKIEPNNNPTQLNRAKALLSLGYRKQGLLQIQKLLLCKDKSILSQAQALLLTHR